ncbi:S1 RNA-binding domain-containing protein [Candidatus Karelsulcia muelleri]|uniref:SSU ribosomal protein S1p n=1 Tax=Candidatus Karelsulcia muelleri TaxID=336810 RepID=A0A346E0W6_9FLAO|nr:S1 RNA-binding domain-containing protein [Candidatus Karelsulcia muelleri]AXN02621.1 SSU ribosomal protein S1p [Candidatus Karelsulcia muelleri]WDI79558.1 S1 RNA-binding domain-containing protein [Candidatus Karelsulcia muelleri]WDR79016.1 S1 RNA-binding domain-containing protein [Candidatus Karelsulcia muelleri]
MNLEKDLINKNGHSNIERKKKDKKTLVLKSKEIIKLLNLYSSTINKLKNQDIKTCRILKIKNKRILIDIGFKYDCILSINELKTIELQNRELKTIKLVPKVNQLIDVLVEKLDYKGKCFLSYLKAKKIKSWNRVNEAYKNNELVTFLVLARTKGGLIVSLYNIECFLPGSQVEYKKVTNFDYYVGHILDGKIVKINKTTKNIVVSHKIILDKINLKKKKRIVLKLTKGIIVEGIVKNITNYGCFIALGRGLDGLCHISDISFKRIRHPVERINLGETRKFLVLYVDILRKRVQLGLKQLFIDDCKFFRRKVFFAGNIIKGKIKYLRKFGILVEIYPSFDGLLHKKEVFKLFYKFYNNVFINFRNHFSSVFLDGNVINILILESKFKRNKIYLSFKVLLHS